MKKLILFFAFFFIFQISEAQKNLVYVELLGSGGLYSLNYERTILNNGEIFNARIGLAYYGDYGVLMPLGLNMNIGKKNTFFQLSVNKTLGFSEAKESRSTSLGVGIVHRVPKGFYFHSSLLCLILNESINFSYPHDPNAGFNVLPWVSLGFGSSF